MNELEKARRKIDQIILRVKAGRWPERKPRKKSSTSRVMGGE